MLPLSSRDAARLFSHRRRPSPLPPVALSSGRGTSERRARALDDIVAAQLALQEVPADARTQLLDLAQGPPRRRRPARLWQRAAADPPQELERLGADDHARRTAVPGDRAGALAWLRALRPLRALRALAMVTRLHVLVTRRRGAPGAGRAQQGLAMRRQHRSRGERRGAARAGVRRREDAAQAQDPALEVARRHVLVNSGEQRFEGRVEEPEEQLGALVLLRELEHVIGEVTAEQDAFEVRLQAMDRPHQLDRGDAHQVASRLLEPGDQRLAEGLQLAGEAAVPGTRAARHAALLAALARQEGDDAIAFGEVADIQQDGFRGMQEHGRCTRIVTGYGDRRARRTQAVGPYAR